jgi:hypothetical protein
MGEVLYFHGYNVPHTAAEIIAAGGDESKLPAKSIWWQGRNIKRPCELEGIESTTTGSDAQPTLRVGTSTENFRACLITTIWLWRGSSSMRRKNSIWMRRTFRTGMPPLIRRRRNGSFFIDVKP